MTAAGDAGSAATLSALGRFVREVGFPAIVAGFVLYRLDARVEAVAASTAATASILEDIRGRVCVCAPAGLGSRGGSSSTAPSVAPRGQPDLAPARPARQFRSLGTRARVPWSG